MLYFSEYQRRTKWTRPNSVRTLSRKKRDSWGLIRQYEKFPRNTQIVQHFIWIIPNYFRQKRLPCRSVSDCSWLLNCLHRCFIWVNIKRGQSGLGLTLSVSFPERSDLTQWSWQSWKETVIRPSHQKATDLWVAYARWIVLAYIKWVVKCEYIGLSQVNWFKITIHYIFLKPID